MQKYQVDIVTITIATKGRQAKLAACLRSIDYPSARVFIGAESMEDMPSPFSTTTQIRDIPVAVNIISGHPVQVHNHIAEQAGSETHILPISDDIIFEPGAIQSAVNELHTVFPDTDGVIGFDIRNMSQKDKCSYAYMLIGKKFFNERLGRKLFHAEYHHFYADMELGENANKLGRFRMCHSAGLIHFHPSAGYLADKTHREGRQEKWSHDHKIYMDRKQNGKIP